MKHSVSREQLLDAQRNEASEYETYSWLASRVRDESNRAILERIAGEERRHYEVFKRLRNGRPAARLVCFGTAYVPDFGFHSVCD